MLSVDEAQEALLDSPLGKLGAHSKKTRLYNAEVKAILLKITGRVHGVFFRAATKRAADELGVTGWVRNCDDGSVEVFVQGTEEALKKLEQWCTRGPPSAKVEDIEREEVPPEDGRSFEIRY